jgi:hypothetical protein
MSLTPLCTFLYNLKYRDGTERAANSAFPPCNTNKEVAGHLGDTLSMLEARIG